MTLTLLYGEFTVSKLARLDDIDFTKDLLFIAKTADELSVVCETHAVPQDTLSTEHGWRILKVEGELDFGLVGIIAEITSILAAHKIPVFVVSTYNTDYILVKEALLAPAIESLRKAGYHVNA